MKTDSPAPDVPTVEVSAEGVNDLDSLVNTALQPIFRTCLPADNKLLDLKDCAAKMQREFYGCEAADQEVFTFRHVDQSTKAPIN